MPDILIPAVLSPAGFWNSGVLRGELRKDLELESCIDLIFAPIFYRLLITGDRIDESFTRELISYALSGLEPKRIKGEA